jgi:hypothetical protein
MHEGVRIEASGRKAILSASIGEAGEMAFLPEADGQE